MYNIHKCHFSRCFSLSRLSIQTRARTKTLTHGTPQHNFINGDPKCRLLCTRVQLDCTCEEKQPNSAQKRKDAVDDDSVRFSPYLRRGSLLCTRPRRSMRSWSCTCAGRAHTAALSVCVDVVAGQVLGFPSFHCEPAGRVQRRVSRTAVKTKTSNSQSDALTSPPSCAGTPQPPCSKRAREGTSAGRARGQAVAGDAPRARCTDVHVPPSCAGALHAPCTLAGPAARAALHSNSAARALQATCWQFSDWSFRAPGNGAKSGAQAHGCTDAARQPDAV